MAWGLFHDASRPRNPPPAYKNTPNVSNHWRRAAAVLDDLERFPRRQAFALRQPREDLIGFQDAAEFDFLSSRFRTAGKRRQRRRRRKPAPANA